jgi:hypothetical protein
MSSPRISFQKHVTRRELGRIALGGALGTKLLSSPRTGYAKVRPQPSGIKLGSVAPANPTEDDLLCLRQLGADAVFCAVTRELNGVEGLLHIKKRYAVWPCGTQHSQSGGD